MTNYTALARGACRDSVEKIHRWKEDSKLKQWKEEDLRLDSAVNGINKSSIDSTVNSITKSSIDSPSSSSLGGSLKQ